MGHEFDMRAACLCEWITRGRLLGSDPWRVAQREIACGVERIFQILNSCSKVGRWSMRLCSKLAYRSCSRGWSDRWWRLIFDYFRTRGNIGWDNWRHGRYRVEWLVLMGGCGDLVSSK
jgi:hypothetical protein